MAEWKDVYSGWGKDKIIKGSDIELGKFRLVVHRHIHYLPDVWLASCPYVFECLVLSSRNLDGAKLEAIDALKTILTSALKSINSLEG